MLRQQRQEVAFEYVTLTDEEIKEAAVASEQSYSSIVKSTIADSLSQGFVYTAKTIGGCFFAVTFAPRALPVVVKYIVPAAGMPGAVASTTAAVVSVVSFGLGSNLGTRIAQTALNVSSSVFNRGLTYVFSSKVSTSKKQEEYNEKQNDPSIKCKMG